MARPTTPQLLSAAGAVGLCVVPAIVHAAGPGGLVYATNEPVSGPGGTLVVRSAVLLHRTLHIKGTLSAGVAGARVVVERRQKDGTWARTAVTRTTAHGAFAATWKANHIGRFPTRAVGADARPTGTATVTVYKAAYATYFGHGFYGKKMACGSVLTHRTLGVAHRTLPCGTNVALYFRGRAISVPVVDRGPYGNHATWDLTEATASALRMTSSSKIGAVRAP